MLIIGLYFATGFRWLRLCSVDRIHRRESSVLSRIRIFIFLSLKSNNYTFDLGSLFVVQNPQLAVHIAGKRSYLQAHWFDTVC